jgi:hypothetical protein
MATISEEQRMKFLMKARAKKAQPEDKVDAFSQLEVVESNNKKKKKKRKADQGCIRMEISNKGSGSAVVAAAEARGQVSP